MVHMFILIRSRSVCSKDTIHTELDHLQEVFESNAFPPSLVTLTCIPRERKEIVENTEKQPAILATPYVKGLSGGKRKEVQHQNCFFLKKNTEKRVSKSQK